MSPDHIKTEVFSFEVAGRLEQVWGVGDGV